ncbi:hypothetical protein J1N35_034656 [Gossypium stocksii]|uniref:Uncharacterized protein n=1 Tax=Gossypium stocksii TaxID=47602 RepID=A0A9D3USR5_9ROSI|nr:hypothetical protein J1N35_034656 [Gossypium stocksii]
MSKCYDTMKTIQKQLDLLLEAIRCRAREHIPVDECVELDNVEVEEEVPYIIIEQQDLRVDCQHEIEVE